jgi:outer membrane protein, heavy metal efflux system
MCAYADTAQVVMSVVCCLPLRTCSAPSLLSRIAPWMKRWWQLWTASLVALCGCATYHPAPLDPQHGVAQFAARRLDDRELQAALARLLPQAAAAWPPQEWDRAQLLAVALVRNPQLAVARDQVQVALAHEITAGQMLNPDLTLQSEYGAHGDPHPWLYGVALDWVLRSPGRRHLEQDIARLDTANTRFQLMDGIWALRHELIAALSDWESARRRLTLLDRLAAAQDKLVLGERKRVQAGEDSPSESVTLEQGRIETEQQQAQARAAADAAQVAAARALGFPPDELNTVRFAWADWGVPPDISAERSRVVRERALLSRSDLEAAIGEYSIAEAQFKLAVKRQYPQLTVGPGYYWDHGINKFPLDVGFTLPLNGNKGEIAEARAARDVTGKRMLALQANIFGEIAAAERAEHLARTSTDTAERRLENARHQAVQSELSLHLGESNVMERVGAEILAIRAELEVLEMRAQLQTARNNLEDVLHTPLSGPEVALAQSPDSMALGAGS